MSEGAPEAVELPNSGDAAFGALMDALAPEPEGEAAGSGGEATGAAAGADPTAGAGGDPAAGAAGAAPAAGAADPAGAPAAGAPGAPADAPVGADGAAAADAGAAGADGAVGAAAGTGGDAGRPAAWTADAATLAPKLGELSTKLEERTTQAYQSAALEEVKTEHARYFEALEQHPRLLVGKQVPGIGGNETETLRDTEDAREWQEAVKSLLVEEVRGRADKALDENAGFMQTLHASIELFQNNHDLLPGTKGFDVELANKFATFAKPYELRVEGKLQGYSIQVQPIIDQLRTQLTAERQAAAKPAASDSGAGPSTTGTAPTPPGAATAATPQDQPQAGIASKAGAGGAQADDFSALFGTIGLPDMRI